MVSDLHGLNSPPKREGLLKAICEAKQQCGSQCYTPPLNVCVTRWAENIDGWERFALTHPFLVLMCEAYYYGDPAYPLFIVTGQQRTRGMP